MKISGKRISEPKERIVVIPRDSGDIVFKAKAVLDFDEFDKMCPEPEVPFIRYSGKEPVPNPNSEDYKKQMNEWATKKMNYIILKSLSATEGLEWENVNLSLPETWENLFDELKESFSAIEINEILKIVNSANGLSEETIKEATDNFLASQAQQEEVS